MKRARFSPVQVDVPMVEPISNLGRQHAIEGREVHEHPGGVIDRAGHRDIAHVAVAVIVGARTIPEDLTVTGVVPVGAAIAVCGRERHASRQ
jgi:hypothetical protein